MISIIDIVLSFNIEHTSTAGRGGASTGVSPIHYIRVGDSEGSGIRNADSAEDSIILSSSL